MRGAIFFIIRLKQATVISFTKNKIYVRIFKTVAGIKRIH